MKRILALFLALMTALSVTACGQSAAAPETTDAPQTSAAPDAVTPTTDAPQPTETPAPVSAAFPALGDMVCGFTVKALREFPLIGAQTALFEHERTGARLLYIANSDTNRVFDLTFFTRAIDNTGLPHIFEHSTLDGSEKYPSKALFFNLIYQTYNTYMNAYTQPLLTSYPVASLSEAQLLKYADYYTDSCLHPLIMTDESIFLEESWRYRLDDMDGELTIEGTVYSEMRGAIDLNSAASSNMLRLTFPGSTIGNEYGGEPDFIPDMTWESLRAYHDLYYHPSNCLGFLYGDFEDYTAFLHLLDEAFAPFEKREFLFEDPDYVALTESVVESCAFPVEAGSDAENGSTVFYSIVCPGLNEDLQEELVLNTLTDLLLPAASPMMQKLKKELPGGDFGCHIECNGPEDAIVFYGVHLNPEDAETFRRVIDAALAEIAETGFAQDYVDGVVSSLAMSTKLIGEGSSIGTDVIASLAYSCASSGDVFNYIDYVEALDRLDEWNGRGLYQKAIRDWLLDAAVTTLVITYPQPGLREELDAKEAERLAAVKAGMSEDELQAIVARTHAEEEPDDSSAYVAALQTVTVDSLPEELRHYEVRDELGEDGVRRLNAAAGVDGVGKTVLLLDAAGLAQEEIHWFALYTALLGEMDTAAHDREALAVLTTRYLYNGEIRLSLMPGEGDDYHPYLRCDWIAADEDLAQSYDLVYEILFDTQFDDAETLQGLVSRTKSNLKSSITAQPFSVMLQRAFSSFSSLYGYYNYYNNLDYYAFLEQVEQQALEDPAAVAEHLRAVQRYFHNAANAVTVYAGSEAGIALNRSLADTFLEKLDHEPIEPVSYTFEKPAQREALIVDSKVQYNGVIADFETLGMDGFSGDLDALTAAVNDLYLYPRLRDQYGAYGVYNQAEIDAGMYVFSYRDPNIRESFAVYEALPAFVRELEIDQAALDGYILSSYAGYAMPSGELSGAISAAVDVLTGDSKETYLQYMRDLKSLTPEAVRAYAEAYEKLMSDGLRFTAGGAAAINANADLYDVILNPFGTQDSAQTSFEDLPEDHPHYEAVRYLYDESVLFPLEADRFGVDETATAGDLIGMLYALIGGDASAVDEAIELFAEYDILKADAKADEALSAANAENILKKFSTVLGVNYKIDAEAGDALETRGELAARFVKYLDYLESLGVIEG